MWWADYVGVPFVHGGRSEHGLDCWGLVVDVYRNHRGILLPSLSEHYTDASDPVQGIPLLEREAMNWKPCPPTEFAVALFRPTGAQLHVGVMIDEHRMLHTTPRTDCVVEFVHRIHAGQFAGCYAPKLLAPHPPTRHCDCRECQLKFADE
jgi:cell wall-associated NlpC family hydrolase